MRNVKEYIRNKYDRITESGIAYLEELKDHSPKLISNKRPQYISNNIQKKLIE